MRSVETAHFRLHYPEKLRPYAERIAQISEAVHDTLSRRYGIDLKHTTEIVIENSLLATGYANPATDRIAISVTDWGFTLRSQHDWLRNVVTHEYSHILSLARGAKVPGWLFGFILSYSDQPGEMIQKNGALVAPFRSIPVWFSEGTAQYETERLGFDCWDAHRDMILRRAVLDSALFSLSEMGQFAELREIDLERAPYTQGFALVRYIAERWGDEAIVQIWRKSAEWSWGGFASAVKSTTGYTPEELYDEWKKSITAHYQRQREAIGTPHEGKALTQESWLQDRPQFDQKGRLYFLSNLGSTTWNSSLVRLPADTAHLSPAQRPDSNGVWPLSEWLWGDGFALKNDFLERGYSVWATRDSTEPDRIAYVTYRYRDAQHQRRLDLVSQDSSKVSWLRSKKEHRLTHLADAVDPDYRADGQALLYVSRDPHSARFSLWSVALDETGAAAGEPRLLLQAPNAEKTGEEVWNFGIYTPRWSPSGDRIAFSWFDGNYRRIGVIDTLGNWMATPTVGGNDERDPVWLGDTTLLFSSNRGGIFNLWTLSLSNNEAKQITRMVGGAFSPAVSPDLKRVVFVGYDRDGFSLRSLQLENELPEGGELAPIVRCPSLSLRDVEYNFANVDRSYHPLPSRFSAMPIISAEKQAGNLRGTGEGVTALKTGINLLVDDPLQHNQLSLLALIEVNAGFDFIKGGKVNDRQQKDFLFSWENRSFPVVSQASFFYRNIHAEDTLVSEDQGHPTSVVPISILYKGVEEHLKAKGFSSLDSLSLWGGWESGRFNLYEDHFAWDFYTAWRLGAGWGIQSRQHQLSQVETLLQPSGWSLLWALNYRWASLFRTGKFYESFVIDASGQMPRARLRDWGIFDVGAMVFYGHRWRFGVTSLQLQGNSVPYWSSIDAPGDSLDSFFYPIQQLVGYPLLKGDDDYLIQGVHVGVVELRHTFPLWSSNFTWRSFAHRGASLALYAQAARSSSRWDDFLQFDHGDWLRGVGMEMRLSQRVFYGIPFEFWVGFGKALDKIGQNREISTLGKGLLPHFIAPTSLNLGIGLQFWNPGLALQADKYRFL